MARAPRWPARLAAPAILLTGCAVVAPIGGADAPAPAGFPECSGVDLAFFGQNTTLAAIGLGANAGPDANKPGTIWVTAEPPDPAVFGAPAGGPQPPPQRWVCVEWPDGSGMGMSIEDSWEPPAGLVSLDGGAGAGEPVLPVVILAIAAIAVVGISFLAFRGERPAT